MRYHMPYLVDHSKIPLLWIGIKQRGWNQKRVYEALCCDGSKLASQLLSFQSQNLSLVKSLLSGFGKIKKGSWNFWRRVLFNHFWGSCSCSVWGENSYIFLLLLLKFPKVENIQRFLSAVCFKTKPISQQSTIFILSGASFWIQPFWYTP